MNFQHIRKAVPASVKSESDGLVFGVSLFDMRGKSPNESPGTFTMCYCDDQKDNTLELLGNSDTTYKLYDDVKCGLTPYPVDAELYVVANLFIPEHQCEAKCSKGCTGPFCFCSGYDKTSKDETLCLSPALCREACDAIPDCGGIQIHDELPQCTLLTKASPCIGAIVNGTSALNPMENPMEAEDWQLYTKINGSACTHLSDFTERAGTLFITNRVEVSVDYVLHPGEPGSIEITSPSSYMAAEMLRKERKLQMPVGYYYCYDANINVDDKKVPWEGTMKPLADYQCYNKCASGGGEGCDGLYSGYDGPESNALCLDQQMCQYMCDQLEDCGSIDMHKKRSRCFLNKKDECDTH